MEVTVGHPPQLATDPQRVYVSYAWADVSSAWVDELEQRLPTSLQLVRDKTSMRPGQWISEFMHEIGRARLVVVVLSGKYLRSRYCMRELLHLHDQSLGERAHLMQRVVPLVVGDLQISDAIHRLEHVAFWKKRHDKLEAMMSDLGIAAAGGAARDELLLMKDFQHRTDELLAWMDDVLIPRGKQFSEQTIQTVNQLLLERAGMAPSVNSTR